MDCGLVQFHTRTLLSRALQDDGWLATVSDAPLPPYFIGGASVAHDTEQPSPQLTPARRSSKWDAAERHQSSRRPPHEPGCQDPEVIGEALTRAPVCRPEEHVVVKVARCGSAAGAPDQEVVRREALGLGRFDVHLRQRSGVDNVLGFQQ
ncbi:hypothetical protein EVAR_75125_1 [Eumeta japonica]|uniref:Uncharacterized protein n=1 Tax=Eumeta variegata TaxID=151549 RepID=A0A4C1U0J1_EUMVA|nr:hypothetical protein EVAR_75125_1 [Eumeta japonica]